MRQTKPYIRIVLWLALLAGLLLSVKLQAQDPVDVGAVGAAAPGPAAAAQEMKSDDSVWGLILHGGPVMIPLGIASIIALAISFERFVSLRKKRIIPNDFLVGLKSAYDLDPDRLEKAIQFCELNKSPAGNIFKQGLLNVHRGPDAAERAVEDAGGREVDKMKRSLRGLSIIASVSPLLGLLGTVYGMISAFKLATEAGMGKADVLAGGIYEALVTTATGLTIAVPVLLLFQYFSARVDAIVDDIDEHGLDFIQHIFKRESDSARREETA